MNGTARRPPVAALAIFLVALTLRPAITAVGPVLGRIGDDLGLGEAGLGLLGALPLIAFAVVSPLVHRLSARGGVERTLLWALVGLTAGIILRSWTGQAGLWIGTLVLGAAIAISNVLVPVVVKGDFPGRVSWATGLYSAFIAGSAAVGAAVAVPLADVGGWRLALGAWALLAAAVTVAWWVRSRRRHVAAAVPEPDLAHATVWRSPTAWLVTLYMGLQATTFYVLVTWLPTIEVAAGYSEHTAGVHLFVFQIVGIVGGLAVPSLMRPDSQRAAAVAGALTLVTGLAGMLLAPDLILVWVAITGIGSGASLVVSLTLMSVRGRTAAEATQLSGMAQSLGYALAAVGPVAAGVLGELTGGWTPVLVMLLTAALLQIGVGIAAGTGRDPGPKAA
ncbi:MFS transporter [Demequina lignilytica]|uniref:MFS transporter n=1 Tax=Demequina lignilytica TaxID=3051663 RepID=A0AB35MKH5_9MICO|nr:MFS transporter [Demequina sp. SYSU T0a273]MDN4484296.1 MFS transporter [Demequina sp. SYSU T0a273]